MTGLSILRMALFFILCGFSAISQGQDMKTSGADKAPGGVEMNDAQKRGYAMGADIGNYLKVMKGEFDLDMFTKGLKDVFEGRETVLSTEEIDQAKQQFIEAAQAKKQQEMEAQGEKNMKEGEAFLAGNKNKEGVNTTESGLQYIILKEGDGPMPEATDQVKVHYRGTLIDGTEFDSSFARGEPATFGADRVIKGWTEALQLMKVGSKYKLFIPSELAYGKRGAGRDIPPNSTLIFEVELLGIE